MGDMLSTGVSGLLAFQQALDTTSNNISNANTPGYSRESVNLVSVPGPYIGGVIDRQRRRRQQRRAILQSDRRLAGGVGHQRLQPAQQLRQPGRAGRQSAGQHHQWTGLAAAESDDCAADRRQRADVVGVAPGVSEPGTAAGEQSAERRQQPAESRCTGQCADDQRCQPGHIAGAEHRRPEQADHGGYLAEHAGAQQPARSAQSADQSAGHLCQCDHHAAGGRLGQCLLRRRTDAGDRHHRGRPVDHARTRTMRRRTIWR